MKSYSSFGMHPISPIRLLVVLATLAALDACTTTTCGPGGTGLGDGGAAVCGNHACETGESATSCPADCTTSGPVCGNHACEAGESAASCPADCTTSVPVCGNHVCEATEDPTSCPADCGSLGCPSVAGDYLLGLAPAADPSCPAGTSDVTVTQAGCSVTVTNILPTPITFTIDPAGGGFYTYSMGGFSGTLTFGFSPGSFIVTDTGANALCPGLATQL